MNLDRRHALGVAALGAVLLTWSRLRTPDEAAEPEVLAKSSNAMVVLDRWREGSEAGWLVAARFPRDAALEITPSDLPVRFSDLLPTDDGDWAAVNGGFYDGDGKPMELVISEGHQFSPLRKRGGSGVLEADPFPMRVVHRDAWTPGARFAIQSIDRLVDQGASVVGTNARPSLAARTAVVISDDATWAVVAFSDSSCVRNEDGFSLQATSGYGLTMAGFAQLLVDQLHASQALNFDGAVSTQLAAHVGGQSLRVIGERGTVQSVILRTEPSRPSSAP